MSHNLYHIPPEQGPKIVGIGGGTGLSTLLRGLKLYTRNITAIVTVADDGGSTGMLRHDLGMAAPGDIRSCLQSLANCEPLMAQLMAYRFTDGSLAGQSLGNLLLAALNDIMPSFDKAVAGLSKVLAITGRVLPVTNENVQLEATFENGATVLGESHIFYCKKEQGCRIRSVRLLPEHPKALDAAVRDYVFSFPQTGEFMAQLEKLLLFLLPQYNAEGKTVLVISVGCTGGHHRSVAVAHALAQKLTAAGFAVTESHRDISR